MKRFADRLREARIAAGLTQEQLGFMLDVTKSSVSAWENDRETPSFRLLPKLRQALARSLDELICDGRPTVVLDTAGLAPPENLMVLDADEQALLLRYRDMDAKRRQALLSLIQP